MQVTYAYLDYYISLVFCLSMQLPTVVCLPVVTYCVAQNFGDRKLQGSKEEHIGGENLLIHFIIVIISMDAKTF